MILVALLIVLVLTTWAIRVGFSFDWAVSTICGLSITMVAYIGYFTWVFNHLTD